MKGVAVIVVDMVNDFIKGSLKIERAKHIIPRIKDLLDAARANGVPVVYVCDTHIPPVDKELKLWGNHAIANSWGAEVIDELKPMDGDFIVRKRRYSSFYGTDLDLLLRELGITTLILTGVATDICIQHTAADAFFRGYEVVVPEDCVESISEDNQKSGLDYMRRVYGAKIVTSKELINLKMRLS
ncbi:MAG: isochorismatase family cysteine hydrolase [Candidatus Nezhaarchaeales archaeon]